MPPDAFSPDTGSGMSNLLQRIYASVSVVTDRSPLSADEKLRLQHYTVFLLLGTPTMMLFAILNLTRGDLPVGLSVCICVAGQFLGWALIRRGLAPVIIYRINVITFGALLLYLGALGSYESSTILWSYPFPLITFFLFGRREGWFWVLVVYLGLAFMLLVGETPFTRQAYAAAFAIRFLITYAMVTVFTFWFEYFREEYRRQADEERERLQQALHEVKELTGLLPICSACKKIRDDQGYWNQLETYIHERTDARFSHGICPDCMERLYPEVPTGSDPDPAD